MGLGRYVIATLFVQLLIISQNGCLCTISCFTCTSRNGSDVDCEDPFHPGNTTYTERCKVPKRGHKGEFPAHFCIKIIGKSYTTKEKLIIRRCVVENMDSQCGNFRLGNDVLHGCILTCDLDGCNSSSYVSLSHILVVPTIILLASICLPLFSPNTESIKNRSHSRRQAGGHSMYDERKNFPSKESKRSLCAMKSNPFSGSAASYREDDDSVQLGKSIVNSINRIRQDKSRL